VIFEIDQSWQNSLIGGFGVPDTEIYTDDLSENEYKTLLGDCEITSEDLSKPEDVTDEFHNYFEDPNSAARPCFPVVSIDPYLSMSDVSICTVATAYQQRCTSQGVENFSIPAECDQNRLSNIPTYYVE